jgi:hypothetical protein
LSRWKIPSVPFVETSVQSQPWSNKVIEYTHRLGDTEPESSSLETRQAVRVFQSFGGIYGWKNPKTQSIDNKDGRSVCITWYKYLIDKKEDQYSAEE